MRADTCVVGGFWILPRSQVGSGFVIAAGGKTWTEVISGIILFRPVICHDTDSSLLVVGAFTVITA